MKKAHKILISIFVAFALLFAYIFFRFVIFAINLIIAE
jgi:hypothetical protein